MRTHQLRLLIINAILILLLLPGLVACGRNNRGSGAPLDSNAIATAAAATVQAQSILLTSQAGAGAQPPAASGAPVISASVDTNCREGPGKEYASVGYLGAGQQSAVLGTEPSGNWWLIANPKNPAQSCWVWAETTTVTGDLSPVGQPSPSFTPWSGQPLPSFTPWPGQASPTFTFTPTPWNPPPSGGPMTAQARYTELGMCNGKEYAFFEIVNTSAEWMKSQDVTFLEHGSNRNLGQTRVPQRPFLMAPLGCGGATDLKAGSTGYINAQFSKQPAPGALVDASITLCSEPNYVGKCTSVLVQFNYPGQTSQPSQPEILAVQVNFMNIHFCTDSFYAIFELVNNGALAVKSSQVTLTWKGTTDLIGQSTSNKGGYLTDKNGCLGNLKAVEPGTNAFVRGTMGSTMPYPSRAVDALVKSCSEQNLGGRCTEIKFPFTVP